MAAIYDNPKGFLIIEGSVNEFTHKCNFGINRTTLICDRCNNIIKTNFENCKDVSKAYYVAVLNMILCEDCVDKFIANSIRYDDDIPIEERNFKNVCHALGLEMPEN